MKIVCVDNYDREYYDDVLIAENVHEYWGKKAVNLLNENEHENSENYFILVNDDHKLFKFKP